MPLLSYTRSRHTRKLGDVGRKTLVPSTLAALFAAAITASGCNHTPTGPVTVVEVFDFSVGCRSYLPSFIKLSSSLAGRLDPDKDRLIDLRLGNSSEEIFDGTPPESADQIVMRLANTLQKPPSTKGTMPALAWTDLANRLRNEKQPTAIIFWSDSDDDSRDALRSMRTITAAAKELAANPHIVSVTFCGANPSNRETLRKEFAAFGSRLHIYGIRDMTLNPLLAELDNARPTLSH